jgi:two-component system, response regulator
MMADKIVLLVEDNENDVILTERAFRKCRVPAALIVAGDGVEALDFLFCRKAHAGRDPFLQPSLILLDLNLPRVNGLEVLRQIRSDPQTAKLPVIVLTSSLEEKDRTECYRLGANDYFRKPVEFDLFMELVQQLKVNWLKNS